MDMTPGKEGWGFNTFKIIIIIMKIDLYRIKSNKIISGTWLGMSTLGKIGVLLNLDKNDHGFDQNKEGRGKFLSKIYSNDDKINRKYSPKGFLVPNFLNSDLNASKYANTLKPNDYNPFNLVLFEPNEFELLFFI